MNARIFTLACLIGLSNMLCYQSLAQHEISIDDFGHSNKSKSQFYFSLNGQLAIPQGALKEYSNTRGGFNLELGASFRKIPSFSAGIEIGGIFSSSKKDNFKGLEVTTQSTLVQFFPFIRWAPKKDLKVKPFLDASAGILSASTTTTSVIVDEPTFLNEVLFGAESSVETTTHMDVTSTSFSYGIGAGIVIKEVLMFGVRYYHASPMQYVNKDEVFVKNDLLQYPTARIPLDMIVVTVGISNWGSHK